MKILIQIGIVFGLYWISQCIESILPVPFPASVISLLLLLLILRVVKVEHIREKADFLLSNLAIGACGIITALLALGFDWLL